MEDIADSKSEYEYSTTCITKLELSDKDKKASVKVNKRYGTPQQMKQIYLQNGKEYFTRFLLNNSNS